MKKGIVKCTVWFQALYYLLTGIWPLLHITSFMWVTGPKIDLWLVRMVGLLAATIGIVLFIQLIRGKRLTVEIFSLAILSSISFIAIDIWYASRDVISDLYLADAAIQVLIIAGWLIALGKTKLA